MSYQLKKLGRYEEAKQNAEALVQYLELLQDKEQEYDLTGDKTLLPHIDGTEKMMMGALDGVVKNLPKEIREQFGN